MTASAPALIQIGGIPTLYTTMKSPPMVLEPQAVADTLTSLHTVVRDLESTLNTNVSGQSGFNAQVQQDIQALSTNVTLLIERVKQVEELASFAGMFAEFVKNYHPTVANDFAAFLKVKERIVPVEKET
jgi:hypothetical protein